MITSGTSQPPARRRPTMSNTSSVVTLFLRARMLASWMTGPSAVGSEKANAVMNNYSDATLINLIRMERVKELCFEGHNFFDITRWKQNLVRESKSTSTARFIAYPSDYFVLPIPQDELYANTSMQPNPTVNSGSNNTNVINE